MSGLQIWGQSLVCVGFWVYRGLAKQSVKTTWAYIFKAKSFYFFLLYFYSQHSTLDHSVQYIYIFKKYCIFTKCYLFKKKVSVCLKLRLNVITRRTLCSFTWAVNNFKWIKQIFDRHCTLKSLSCSLFFLKNVVDVLEYSWVNRILCWIDLDFAGSLHWIF